MAKKAGVVCDGLIYAKGTLISDTGAKRLQNMTEEYFKSGAPAIYYSALYAAMKRDDSSAFRGGHINSAQMLRTYITEQFLQYVPHKKYFAPDEAEPDIMGHIKSVARTLCGQGTVKIDDAVDAMPCHTLARIMCGRH